MKIILDTNVFISAVFWGGKPQKVLKTCLEDLNQIIVSEEILDEYIRVMDLLAKKYVPEQNVHVLLDYLVRNSTVVKTVKVGSITSDPKDDMFFEAAISSGCTLMVSGDKHLLERDTYRGISVLTAANFLKKGKSL